MSIVKSALIVLLAISTISTSISKSNLNDKYNDLSEQVAVSSEENSELKSEQESLKSDLQSLSSGNARYKNEILDLEEKVKASEDYESKYTELQKYMLR